MKLGYARVSTEEQSLDLQRSALRKAGCTEIFEDHGISGSSFRRPGLESALNALSPGDTFIVWKLDRLGRSLLNLVEVINDFAQRDIAFKSLTESIDTDSPGGRLIFHMMAALAEFERSLISERTRAGMQEAKKQGRHLGRPFALSQDQQDAVRYDILVLNKSTSEVAKSMNVHPRTITRLMERDTEVAITQNS
ncbi:recombinase family protein [Fodinicurvata fenggangensis]|uniref:recombinase family protein n=1 Tax=Fodinicurvata fenggangensis TaxID=1121830 RepID=UPI00047C3D91|nr:recombinase family protein [Fodinicurvata fenggangensis]